MKKVLVFEAIRSAYGIDQIHSGVTVGELKAMLEELDDNMLIVLSHDKGYTYGSLSRMAEIREEKQDEYEIVDELYVGW